MNNPSGESMFTLRKRKRKGEERPKKDREKRLKRLKLRGRLRLKAKEANLLINRMRRIKGQNHRRSNNNVIIVEVLRKAKVLQSSNSLDAMIGLKWRSL